VPTPAIANRELTAHSCSEALTSVRPKTYDCIQSNLALLANAARGGEASLALGAELAIRSRPLADGLYTVDPEPTAEISRCAELLGLAEAVVTMVTAGGLQERVTAAGGVCYAVGDAFRMPWLPYSGRAHMPHSFLVATNPGHPDAIVVDAYDNQTEWGVVEPGSWQIPWSSLAFPAQLWSWRIREAVPATQTRTERPDAGSYVTAFRAHPDRMRAWELLTTETWLLARWHALFALAHEHCPVTRDVAARWERLAADVFLGSRRMRRGRPESRAPIDEMERLLTAPF
jgi:hypothetical protein